MVEFYQELHHKTYPFLYLDNCDFDKLQLFLKAKDSYNFNTFYKISDESNEKMLESVLNVLSSKLFPSFYESIENGLIVDSELIDYHKSLIDEFLYYAGYIAHHLKSPKQLDNKLKDVIYNFYELYQDDIQYWAPSSMECYNNGDYY